MMKAGIRRMPSRPKVTSELDGSRSAPRTPPSAKAWTTTARRASEKAAAPIPRRPESSDHLMPSGDRSLCARSGKLPSRSGCVRRSVCHQPKSGFATMRSAAGERSSSACSVFETGRMITAASRSWISHSATARYGFDSERPSPRKKHSAARGPRLFLTMRGGSPHKGQEVDHVLNPEHRTHGPARRGALVVFGAEAVVGPVGVEQDLLVRIHDRLDELRSRRDAVAFP